MCVDCEKALKMFKKKEKALRQQVEEAELAIDTTKEKMKISFRTKI